tara:strand:+ start:253 stop:1515 length:1263 start_codon:yes stop_codon:yes gene_type:complete
MDNSDKQMEMLLEEGGVSDDGMSVDPVSGNEIPPGSLATEVRDDIPAMLSEGEYVVPADVLRFYGVKFFEDLRTEAKMGLSGMEQNGRIGGEPVMEEELPFSDEELVSVDVSEPEEVALANGGLMGFNPGGLNVPDYLNKPTIDATSSGTGLEYRKYTNDSGMTISVAFYDGVLMSTIPSGYYPVGEESPQQDIVPKDTPDRDDDDDGGPITPPPEQINWANAEISDYEKALGTKAGKYLPALAFAASPALGMVTKYAINAKNQKMLEGLDSKLAGELSDADRKIFEGFQATLLENRKESEKDTKLGIVEKSGIFGGESTMLEKLEDRNEDGVSFGDTWLGDLLGFDNKAGVQGDSLKDSLGGSRRDGVPSDDDSPSSNPSSDSSSGNSNSFFQNIANSFTPNDGKSYVNGELIEDDKDK